MSELLPRLILIGRGFKAIRLKIGYPRIKYAAEEILEPPIVSKESYGCGTDCIIQVNKQPSIPCLGKNLIAESPQSPDFGTVIGTVNGRGYITAACGSLAERRDFFRFRMTGVVLAGARLLALGFRRRFLGHDLVAPVMTRRRDYRGFLCDLVLSLGVAEQLMAYGTGPVFNIAVRIACRVRFLRFCQAVDVNQFRD